MEDNRFKHITTDPKFRRIPKASQKVKIDKRFKSMFKDKKFKIKYTVDKRGRPVNHSSTEDLKRYYQLSSEDESSNEESELEPSNEESKHETLQAASDDKDESEDSEASSHPDSDLKEEVKSESTKITKEQNKNQKSKSKVKLKKSKVPEYVKKKLKNLNIDYARGEAPIISDSSSDDEESEDELSDSEKIEHNWGELDADADQTEEATYRLAACNMDWDRIRAIDLLVLLNSFLPPGGVLKSVAIYPSEFGKQRMQEEEVKGPIELVQPKPTENENEEGSEYHMEKLRQYQLNRLKYYYAVISFDSPVSANKVYKECDGMEYESSAIKLDLRFIPDDMTFEGEPKDFCDKLPEVNKYQPRFFTTTALQQVKVDLTWDETNVERKEIAEKLKSGKVDDISELDLQNYLASSSGEEDENDNHEVESDIESKDDGINKYRALLQSIEDKENEKNNRDVELEITWGIDLKQKTEERIKQKQDVNQNETPFEKYLKKRKEKKKDKREQRKKNSVNDNDDSDSDIPSDIDMSNPYFSEEFNKPEFKTPKSKKETMDSSDDDVDEQKQAELELLLMNEDDNKEHFNMKNIEEVTAKRKKKKKNKVAIKPEDNFEINVKDERFSALFTSHHYNIDPSDPHYKKTKAMETLANEKLKRRSQDSSHEERDRKLKKTKSGKDIVNTNSSTKTELNMLVKSVKLKTKGFKNKG